jgi:Raf kinase inhibitor-like YbhB/YbcL family protein
MEIKSVFKVREKIPVKYTADGEDINPPLEILDAPQNTKSFALIVDDPDARAETWVHWVVFNIPFNIRKIEENSAPNGAKLGINDAKILKYHGPAPPSGIHRYFFKLYALDNLIDLDEGARKPDIEKAMTGHIIEKAELIGFYGR